MQERGTRNRIEPTLRVVTLVQTSSLRNSGTMMQGFDLLHAGSTSLILQVSIRDGRPWHDGRQRPNRRRSSF
jgi:hypothetical protein